MSPVIVYRFRNIHVILIVLVGLLQFPATSTTAFVSPSFQKRMTATSRFHKKLKKVSSMAAAHNNDQEDDESSSRSTPVTTTTTTASLTLGFIGCGTIASAIVTGLATSSSSSITTSRNNKNTASSSQDYDINDSSIGRNNVIESKNKWNISQIIVSRRSEKNSQALKEQFTNLITIQDNNQAIVDAADIVFLTLLPKQTKNVLQSLRFNNNNRRRQRQLLVSLVSTTKLDELIEYSGLPLDSVYKMICLPAVARRQGICIMTPPVATNQKAKSSSSSSSSSLSSLHDHHHVLDGWLVQLLHELGDVVQADSEEQMSIMTVPSALMGSFYGILRNNQRWLIQQGIPSDKAGLLIGRFYQGMMQDAADKLLFNNKEEEEDQQQQQPPALGGSTSAHGTTTTPALDELIAEQTPGGLNEQGLANLSTLGALKAYDQVQDYILSRIQGKSDGSIPPSS